MRKTFEMLAGGLAAVLFTALASAQAGSPAAGGTALQPIQLPPAATARAADDHAFSDTASFGRLGETTRGLLTLQVSGRSAGKPLLMQEPVAQAAWDRYLKSFQRNLPQWFGERVRSEGSGGGR